MKTLITAALLTLLACPAIAGECERDIAKVDQAIKSGEVKPEQKAQVKDMRDQAEQLCSGGNVQEGIDVLTEVKAMLNME
jgi:uncharacterized protein (UPF0264 family)